MEMLRAGQERLAVVAVQCPPIHDERGNGHYFVA